MSKTIIFKKLKGGGTFEIAIGFDKPFFRNRRKKNGREIYIHVLPTLWVSSTDNYRGPDEYVEQTTIQFVWMFFWLYFEVFRPLKMEEN